MVNNKAGEVREADGGEIAKGLVNQMMMGQVGLKEFMQRNDTIRFEKNHSAWTVL